ncbi:MAG: DUF1624 domain-containing protein [Nitrospira sp.]|nr:DUF1624 domain-containing protein [Nitrospira sp.]
MSPSAAHKSPRVPALDFVKGALVLIMVLYHWLNYFVSIEGDYYRYLRFLTPSFIFITGFLISHVYLANARIIDSKVPGRLMERGLKILAVFILLNFVRAFLIPDSRSGVMLSEPWSGRNLIATFATGNVALGGNGKAAAFNILVPISYLLMISAGLAFVCRFYKYAFHAVCLASISCVLLLALNGIEYGNLELVTVGLMGAILGYTSIERINAALGHPYLVATACLFYLGAVTVWDVSYPLQVVGVCVNLMIIYLIGQVQGEPGRVRSYVLLLGRYSLVGYIAQIAILQALYRSLRPFKLEGAALVFALFAAITLTILTVVILDHARARFTAVDRVYKAVFA